MDFRNFAVHRDPRPDDLTAVRGTDALMSQANAEYGNPTSEPSHYICRDAGFAGGARPGRDDDVGGSQIGDLVKLESIMPANQRRLSQLANIAGEVIDEGIVVVDDEDHRGIR